MLSRHVITEKWSIFFFMLRHLQNATGKEHTNEGWNEKFQIKTEMEKSILKTKIQVYESMNSTLLELIYNKTYFWNNSESNIPASRKGAQEMYFNFPKTHFPIFWVILDKNARLPTLEIKYIYHTVTQAKEKQSQHSQHSYSGLERKKPLLGKFSPGTIWTDL